MRDSNSVFIGGDARSGTTLLVDLIGLHPELSPIYETNFLTRIVSLLTKYGWVSRIHGPSRIREIMRDACTQLPTTEFSEIRGTGERFLHGPNHILIEPQFVMEQTAVLEKAIRWGNKSDALNAFITTLFAEHCRNDQKPRWVNKTPRNIAILPQLYEAMPGTKFIHSVRDGRDVACSNIRRGSRNMPDAAATWIECVRQGQACAASHPEQFLEVRYEDLLEDPRAELDRVFSWLGEEGCAEQVLRKYSESGFRVNSSRVGGWKHELSSENLQEFEQIAGDLIDSLGYRGV